MTARLTCVLESPGNIRPVDVNEVTRGGGPSLFQGPFGYLSHHSYVIQNNQPIDQPALLGRRTFNDLTPAALAGPDQMMSQASHGAPCPCSKQRCGAICFKHKEACPRLLGLRPGCWHVAVEQKEEITDSWPGNGLF